MSHVQVITNENVVVLVQMYFESQQLKDASTDFMKYMQHWQHKGNMSFDETINKNLYDVFWAIRILADRTGKYDFDDIEFHARRNPIFQEINPERSMETAAEHKQLGILRQAIRAHYAQSGGKIKIVPFDAKL
jgi:hypothetical protein